MSDRTVHVFCRGLRDNRGGVARALEDAIHLRIVLRRPGTTFPLIFMRPEGCQYLMGERESQCGAGHRNPRSPACQYHQDLRVGQTSEMLPSEFHLPFRELSEGV